MQQILTFAQQRPVERRIVDLTAVVLEAAGLLQTTLPEKVELVLLAEPELRPVLADVTQLQQSC